jgi:hypothetical protein
MPSLSCLASFLLTSPASPGCPEAWRGSIQRPSLIKALQIVEHDVGGHCIDRTGAEGRRMGEVDQEELERQDRGQLRYGPCSRLDVRQLHLPAANTAELAPQPAFLQDVGEQHHQLIDHGHHLEEHRRHVGFEEAHHAALHPHPLRHHQVHEGSAPSSGVTQEVLRPFPEGEQEQSGDDCVEADCTAPLIHYEPSSPNVQPSDREHSCRSRSRLGRFSQSLLLAAQPEQHR